MALGQVTQYHIVEKGKQQRDSFLSLVMPPRSLPPIEGAEEALLITHHRIKEYAFSFGVDDTATFKSNQSWREVISSFLSLGPRGQVPLKRIDLILITPRAKRRLRER